MNKKNLLIILTLMAAIVNIHGQASFPQLFLTADRCISCHNQLTDSSGQDVSFGSDWRSSMMANAARDPYWHAAVRREIMVHPSASKAIQHECSACHMPMARYMAKIKGEKGGVFAHLPLNLKQEDTDLLAADGVSCTVCHQIQKTNLGKKESFTAGFLVDNKTPLGKRQIFGPLEVDEGRQQLMRSSAQFLPTKSLHIQSSELCASCHTLYTHALNEKGEAIGKLPEQVPYLEWKHSSFAGKKSCQACHMPSFKEKMKISGVMGLTHLEVSRHSFRGGNFLLPRIFNRYRRELGVKSLPRELEATSRQAEANLKSSSAKLKIVKSGIDGQILNLRVKVQNLAGHKLPTAYPSRRVWIHLEVVDNEGKMIFESGRFNPDGSITGNDNDEDPLKYESHYSKIDDPSKVQIYEPILGDAEGRVTTVLLSGTQYLKDNRILPEGFNKQTADKDCSVYGEAVTDDDFDDTGDLVSYEVDVSDAKGPYLIKIELWYQSIGFRWAHNLKDQQAEEISRFVSYYNAFSKFSGIILTSVKMIVNQ